MGIRFDYNQMILLNFSQGLMECISEFKIMWLMTVTVTGKQLVSYSYNTTHTNHLLIITGTFKVLIDDPDSNVIRLEDVGGKHLAIIKEYYCECVSIIM